MRAFMYKMASGKKGPATYCTVKTLYDFHREMQKKFEDLNTHSKVNTARFGKNTVTAIDI